MNLAIIQIEELKGIIKNNKTEQFSKGQQLVIKHKTKEILATIYYIYPDGNILFHTTKNIILSGMVKVNLNQEEIYFKIR